MEIIVNEKILPTVSLKINPVRGLQTHPFNHAYSSNNVLK